jgi:hypothetical protein
MSNSALSNLLKAKSNGNQQTGVMSTANNGPQNTPTAARKAVANAPAPRGDFTGTYQKMFLHKIMLSSGKWMHPSSEGVYAPVTPEEKAACEWHASQHRIAPIFAQKDPA